MSFIPNFLLKKLYVMGSLRQVPEGVAFDLINVIGPGILTRINKIRLNDWEFQAPEISLKLDNVLLTGSDITEENPAIFFINQTGTCILQGGKLLPGKYAITLDLLSKEAGKIVLTIHDFVTGEPSREPA